MKKTYHEKKLQLRPQGPSSLQHGDRIKAQWYPGYEIWAKIKQGQKFKKTTFCSLRFKVTEYLRFARDSTHTLRER